VGVTPWKFESSRPHHASDLAAVKPEWIHPGFCSVRSAGAELVGLLTVAD